MTNKVTYLRIDRQSLLGEEYSCTGTQTFFLIEKIEEVLPGCVWYAADIDTNNFVAAIQDFKGSTPQKVGSACDFIKRFRDVDQFFSGVFLLIPPNILNPYWGRDLLETEDPYTENLGDAILELRAFDTSYFELYISDVNVLEKLQNILNLPQNDYNNSYTD